MTLFSDFVKRVDEDLRRLQGAVYHLAHIDDVFWQVQAVIESNPSINERDVFQEWLVACYADSMVIGLRRLADERRDVLSVFRLLASVKKRAPEFTRQWFVDLHPEPMRGIADGWFTELVDGPYPHVLHATVQAKQDELKRSLRSIEAFGNQYVAHVAAVPTAQPVTLEGVRKAVVAGFRTVQWLRRLISSGVITSPVPVIQSNWLRHLRVPWLAPDQSPPPYIHLNELLR